MMARWIETHQAMRLVYDFSSETASVKSETLVELLCKNRLRFVSDPRDRVYGALGICNALLGYLLAPDYDLSVADVYTAFAWRLVERTGSLSILNQAASGLRVTWALPSWVPDWSSPHDYASERARLVQWPLWAAFGNEDSVSPPRLDGKTLTVRGSLLCAVDDVCPDVVQGRNSLHRKIASLRQWSHLQLPKIHLQTGVRQVGTDGAYAETVYIAMTLLRGVLLDDYSDLSRRMTYAALDLRDAAIILERIELELAQKNVSVDRLDGELSRYAISLYIGMRHCTLFASLNLGLGACPYGTMEDDIVALLAGAKVPFVLRPVGLDRNGNGIYRVVGEAYVYGCMNGEGRKDQFDNDIPLVDVSLV
jgi:hypothetical protein